MYSCDQSEKLDTHSIAMHTQERKGGHQREELGTLVPRGEEGESRREGLSQPLERFDPYREGVILSSSETLRVMGVELCL